MPDTMSNYDLQLAAELGKALLEKNRELEAQVTSLQNTNQEQTMEIQYLKSQLDTMRTMSESRNRIYEEVDRTAQDLEKTNQKLTMEARADKQKIDKQAALVKQLEDKVDDLQKKLDDIKAAEKKVNKKVPEKRRTSSLNRLSLSDSKHGDQGFYFENLAWTNTDQFKNIPLNPYEFEIRKLQDSLQHLKVQQTIDRRKLEDADVEITVLAEENSTLEKKINVLETKLSEAIIVQYELEREKAELRQRARMRGGAIASSGVDTSDIHEELAEGENRLLDEMEDDDPEIRSEAKAVKLESGGSLYSSTESINKVATDAKEIQVGEDASLSILDELESQYQSLFNRYQALIQSKSKKEGEDDTARQRLAHKEVQTLLHITLNRDYYSDSANIPPYKALFKDIFATLRKNRIDEQPDPDPERRHAACSPITSPTEEGGRGVDGR